MLQSYHHCTAVFAGTGGETVIDRKSYLLQAAYNLLRKQERSHIVLNLLTETVNYDGEDCDGYCLMDDIRVILAEDGIYLEK